MSEAAPAELTFDGGSAVGEVGVGDALTATSTTVGGSVLDRSVPAQLESSAASTRVQAR